MSHARDFGTESGDTETARHLIFDYRQADLSEEHRAFCDYATKLTLAPGKMNEQDVQQLRSVGYGDEQISLGTQVIGYFNYINRVADGLGVDAETWMEIPEHEWKERKADFQTVAT